jgi:DNA-binding MarR family transcriptional regulator
MKTLEECAKEIEALCQLDDDGHLVYVGPGSDVKKMPQKFFDGKNYVLSRILYAVKRSLNINDVEGITRMCDKHLCLSADHYCLEKDLGEGVKDGNGWTSTKRQYLEFKLGLNSKNQIEDDKTEDQCLVYPGATSKQGYGNLKVDGKMQRAHVISLRLSLERPIAAGKHVAHTCDEKACVKFAHLVEETPVETSIRKNSKLTTQQILEIYKLGKTKTQQQIAEQFEVVQQTVSSILRGKSYSNITGHKKPEKLERQDFEITASIREELKEYLEQKMSPDVDPDTKETHMIPNVKSRHIDGYVPVSKFGYKTYYHILAAIVQYNLERFPDSLKDENVLHTCKRKDCAAFDHVYIGTHQQNCHDKKRDGTNRMHGTISPETVDLIRKEHEKDESSLVEIARKFNTTYHTIQAILTNRSWNDDTVEPPNKKARTK